MLRPALIVPLVLLTALSTAVADPPAAAVASYQRGMAFKQQGRLQDSARELQAAVKAYPRYMLAHYALAWVYRGLGANEQAIEAFREVIRIAPHSPESVESARAIQRIRLGPGMEAGRPRERVAFSATWEGNTDVYLLELGSGALARLTSHQAVDDSPAWSPDGNHIAFVSDRDGNREIYTTDLDGTNLQRLTDHAGLDGHPVWSPDGRHIAFESNRSDTMDVYIIGVDGTGLRQVTRLPSDERMGDWSPDGTRLAILSNRDGYDKVYVVGAEGGVGRRLTAGTVPEGRPRWSPDGQYIYFTWRLERNAQVCRASLDGRSIANITRSPYNDRLCAVSPDGRRVLVLSDRASQDALHMVDVATGAARRLTPETGAVLDGAFAP